jgi:hypothetical protein
MRKHDTLQGESVCGSDAIKRLAWIYGDCNGPLGRMLTVISVAQGAAEERGQDTPSPLHWARVLEARDNLSRALGELES